MFTGEKMDFLNVLEAKILSVLQTLYDAWGWFGVAGLLVFENEIGITPSEIILGLAGWMLISEHQLPVSMVFIGSFYAAIGSTLGASIPYWVARLGGRPLGAYFPNAYYPC
jgi:membrane protein DedA with SNARE-associated domain